MQYYPKDRVILKDVISSINNQTPEVNRLQQLYSLYVLSHTEYSLSDISEKKKSVFI